MTKPEVWEKMARHYIGRYLQFKYNPQMIGDEKILPVCDSSVVDKEIARYEAGNAKPAPDARAEEKNDLREAIKNGK